MQEGTRLCPSTMGTRTREHLTHAGHGRPLDLARIRQMLGDQGRHVLLGRDVLRRFMLSVIVVAGRRCEGLRHQGLLFRWHARNRNLSRRLLLAQDAVEHLMCRFPGSSRGQRSRRDDGLVAAALQQVRLYLTPQLGLASTWGIERIRQRVRAPAIGRLRRRCGRRHHGRSQRKTLRRHCSSRYGRSRHYDPAFRALIAQSRHLRRDSEPGTTTGTGELEQARFQNFRGGQSSDSNYQKNLNNQA